MILCLLAKFILTRLIARPYRRFCRYVKIDLYRMIIIKRTWLFLKYRESRLIKLRNKVHA